MKNLPKRADLPAYMTKGQLAAQVYPDTTYDTALPQSWVDQVMANGFDPRGEVVWQYPKGMPCGCPGPLTHEAMIALSQMFWRDPI